MSLYHFENARGEEQLAEMRRLDAAGICLFCPGNLEDVQEVLHRTAHWAVTPNRFPYDGARLHLMLVPSAHVTDMVDLPLDAQADFFAALAWVRGEYDLSYYALGVRCGDLPVTGSTIKHLHAHLVVGDLGGEPVRFKMSAPPR